MSGLDSLLNRLRRAYAAVGELEATAARFPSDRFVMANLNSLKRDASDLEALWQAECERAKVEVCRYRLLPERKERYILADVSRSLLEFQQLFSQVYSALRRGLRERARISSEIKDESAFGFGFSYPGSLGIALTVEGDSRLFGTKYDSAIDAFMEVLAIKDENEVRDLAHTLGDAVVKRVYDWSRVNNRAGYGVDVVWTKTNGTVAGGSIGVTSFNRIVNLIERTSDVSSTPLEITGTLKGIDTESKRFHFIAWNEDRYSGEVSEDFDLDRKWSVNTEYNASIVIRTVTEYATQKTKKSFKLNALRLKISD